MERVVEMHAVAALPSLEEVERYVRDGLSLAQIRAKTKRPITMRYVLEDEHGNRETVEEEAA